MTFFKNVDPTQGAKRRQPRKQWLSHEGNRARERRMRQSLARVEKLKDEASRAALARIRAAVADEPDPEAGTMQLVHAALLVSEEVEKGHHRAVPYTWAQSANHMMDRFDERDRDASD